MNYAQNPAIQKPLAQERAALLVPNESYEKTNNDYGDIFVQRGRRMIFNHLVFDPGIANTAYALIQQTIHRHNQKNTYNCLDYGVVKISKKLSHGERLTQIYYGVHELIDEFKPIHSIGCESLFMGRNRSSAMSTSRVIGMIQMIAVKSDILYREVNPVTLKKVITDNGRADKDQMLQGVLNWLWKRPTTLDTQSHHVIDACAVGIWMGEHFYKAIYGSDGIEKADKDDADEEIIELESMRPDLLEE